MCLTVEYRGVTHKREFVIDDNTISIFDACNCEFDNRVEQGLRTAGYGKLLNKKAEWLE